MKAIFALVVLLPMMVKGNMAKGDVVKGDVANGRMCPGCACPGCIYNITLNRTDPIVIFAVKAIDEFYKNQDDFHPRTLVEIIRAQMQVVAGYRYWLDLHVRSSEQDDICYVEVFEGLNQDNPLSAGARCTMIKGLLGAPFPVDVNRPDVHMALEFAVISWNNPENLAIYHKLISVDHATGQIVAGEMYRFYGVQMARTTCMNLLMSVNPLVLPKSCPVVKGIGADTLTCEFGVSVQPWETPAYKLVTHECTDAHFVS